MRTPPSEHVTLVEVLELTRPFEEFAAAVEAAALRLEAEGIEELVTLQFYADPASTEVGSILTFTDRNRMMEHIDMITGWEEFERFFATVRPLDVRVYGELSAEAQEWVGQFGVVSKTFEEHVTGFVR
jgi:hypothetical protein